MPITRNNEEPIYNQQYINYLRAGYNYDVKSKQRTEFFTWLGTGLQMVGSIASFASSIYTGGFGVAMGITLATSSLGSLASSINTTMQAENTFNAKQDQLKLQTSKAYGSDDVDLLEFYSNNRAKFIEYKVSPKMKNLLSDLFFYTGYCCDLMKVPNTTSRTRFNFVSAELILVSTPNISDEMIKDIKDRFYLGITFLHKYNNEWDFSQLKENWEVAVIGS